MAPIFVRDIQRILLKAPPLILMPVFLYGTITLYGTPFQEIFESSGEEMQWAILHISPMFPKGIRFDRFRFRSLLLTESLLLSFPMLIMMLRFSTFLIL